MVEIIHLIAATAPTNNKAISKTPIIIHRSFLCFTAYRQTKLLSNARVVCKKIPEGLYFAITGGAMHKLPLFLLLALPGCANRHSSAPNFPPASKTGRKAKPAYTAPAGQTPNPADKREEDPEFGIFYRPTLSNFPQTEFNSGYFSMVRGLARYTRAELDGIERTGQVKLGKKPVKLKGQWHFQISLSDSHSGEYGYFAIAQFARHAPNPSDPDLCLRGQERWFASTEKLYPYLDILREAKAIAEQTAVFIAEQSLP